MILLLSKNRADNSSFALLRLCEIDKLKAQANLPAPTELITYQGGMVLRGYIFQ